MDTCKVCGTILPFSGMKCPKCGYSKDGAAAAPGVGAGPAKMFNSDKHILIMNLTKFRDLLGENEELKGMIKPQSEFPMSDEQKQAKADAKQRIKQLTAHLSPLASHKDFEFVLNDTRTCYTLDDFNISEAKQLCREWVQKEKNLTALNEQLLQMRETSPTDRQPILNLEARIKELQTETHQLEKQIRTLELVK